MLLYSASQKKRKPINQDNFSENCNDLSDFIFTLLKNSVYPLSFDISYKMYWPCKAKHEPFLNGDVKIDFAQNREFKGLTGSATFQNKGTC